MANFKYSSNSSTLVPLQTQPTSHNTSVSFIISTKTSLHFVTRTETSCWTNWTHAGPGGIQLTKLAPQPGFILIYTQDIFQYKYNSTINLPISHVRNVQQPLVIRFFAVLANWRKFFLIAFISLSGIVQRVQFINGVIEWNTKHDKQLGTNLARSKHAVIILISINPTRSRMFGIHLLRQPGTDDTISEQMNVTNRKRWK